MTGDIAVLTGAVRGITNMIGRLLTERCAAVSIDDYDTVLKESTCREPVKGRFSGLEPHEGGE